MATQSSPPRRISRIEIPKDFDSWHKDLVYSDEIANEYNALLEYMNQREEILAKKGDKQGRYAGFILLLANTMSAMGDIVALPESMGDKVMAISEELVSLATPTLQKEYND